MNEMKLTYLRPWEDEASPGTDSYHTLDAARDVAGYELLYDCYFMRDTPPGATARHWCRLDERGREVEVLTGEAVLIRLSIAPLLDRLASRAPQGGVVPAGDLCLAGGDGRLRAKVCFVTLNTRNDDGGARAAWTGSGYVLIDEHPMREVR
jgi:hypothetical protein